MVNNEFLSSVKSEADFWKSKYFLMSAVVGTFVKALESDDRSASSLASSNPGGAAFANCILGVALAKLRKRYFRRLHPRVG